MFSYKANMKMQLHADFQRAAQIDIKMHQRKLKVLQQRVKEPVSVLSSNSSEKATECISQSVELLL